MHHACSRQGPQELSSSRQLPEALEAVNLFLHKIPGPNPLLFSPEQDHLKFVDQMTKLCMNTELTDSLICY